MFNVTVLKMRDIKKYGIGIIATVTVVIAISKCCINVTKDGNMLEKFMNKNNMIECVEQAVPTISCIQDEEKGEIQENRITQDKMLQSILKTQISSIKGLEKIEQQTKLANEQQNEKKEEEQQLQTARNRISNSSDYK